MHPLLSEVLHERRLLRREVTANHGEILPHRRMGEKLSNEPVPIRFGFGEQQDTGRESIDPVYDQRPLSLQLRGDKREGRRASDPLTGTDASPAGLLMATMASSSYRTSSEREERVRRPPSRRGGFMVDYGALFPPW